MKQISEEEEKPGTSSSNICPEAYSSSVDISFKDDVTVSSLLVPKLSVSRCVCELTESEPEIVNVLGAQESIPRNLFPPAYVGLSYRPTRLHRLSESILGIYSCAGIL